MREPEPAELPSLGGNEAPKKMWLLQSPGSSAAKKLEQRVGTPPCRTVFEQPTNQWNPIAPAGPSCCICPAAAQRRQAPPKSRSTAPKAGAAGAPTTCLVLAARVGDRLLLLSAPGPWPLLVVRLDHLGLALPAAGRSACTQHARKRRAGAAGLVWQYVAVEEQAA
jgi:hypothetical protein